MKHLETSTLNNRLVHNMPLRRATYADLLPASKLLAVAFKDGTLLGAYLHPYRDKYPDDMYLFFLNCLRLDYCKGPDVHIIVTYKVDSSGKEECITGLADWSRKRGGKSTPNLYNRTLVKAMTSYIYLESFIYPNRALAPERENSLEDLDRFIGHHWTGTRGETWYLALIAVDPAHEKQGYGRQLVKYGFDRAREDGVGCSVISAAGKAPFYRACGFDNEVGRMSDEGGEENPVRELQGGVIHFWDNGIEPKGIKKYGEV